MQPITHHVLVVGAGPTGMTTACVLKAINNALNVIVIDKRPEPSRTHGLSIQKDSISLIQEVFAQALENKTSLDQIQTLKAMLKNWTNQFIRTSDIETTLAKQAEKMGIQVLRHADYEIFPGDLPFLLNADTKKELIPENKKNLQALLTAASVIIAADGAHSVVRKELGIELTDEEALRYMAELKYQTAKNTQPRGYTEASFLTSRTGRIGIEIINRGKSENEKPATFFVFVEKDTFDALHLLEESSKIKGTYGNAWNLKELKKRGESNSYIKVLCKTFDCYLENLEKRGGYCTEEKIVGLELKIYRAKTSVKNFAGKHFILIGDANSGLILQRGFNKALKEVALCTTAINEFFKAQLNKEPEEKISIELEGQQLIECKESVNVKKEIEGKEQIPSQFKIYEKATQLLFKKERKGIYFKNKKIKVAHFFAMSTALSLKKMKTVQQKSNAKIKGSMNTSSSVLSLLFKSFSSK